MSNAAAARGELGAFLRSRRRQLAPDAAGLQVTGRRRTPGLRREEVSLLSGVSLTWYTWLEQGRDIAPSRQVMNALARTLRLSAAEHAYVLRLTHHETEASPSARVAFPSHVQRLLDALGHSPAFAITPHWAIVGWNRAYATFYPHVATTPAAERNLLRLVFTDPYVRELLADWPSDSRRFLTQFRAEAGVRVSEPACAELVEGLSQVSEHFRLGWASHDVEQFTSSQRRFEHPRAGTLLLEHHRLDVSDEPDLHVVVYTAAENSLTAAKLVELMGSTPVEPRR